MNLQHDTSRVPPGVINTMFLPLGEVIPIIRTALNRVQKVRMTVTGSSMAPFLHSNDVVELESGYALRLGDIVLVHTEPADNGERYVMHRIVQMDDGAGAEFFIRGDAQQHCEGPFTSDAVLARVSKTWHHGQIRNLASGPWRVAGLIWLRCNPFSFWLIRLARLLARSL